jgi:large subunit ribosomal protein L6
MSRIGKKPVDLPAGVTAKVEGQKVTVKGPKGELHLTVHPQIEVKAQDGKQLIVNRHDDEAQNRALHGLTKKLEIQGVGYQAQLVGGKSLNLSVGFANVVKLPIPAGVTCVVPDPTHITLTGCDRQAVGQFAAVIRRVRPPEPYKGKGIRYEGENVRRKAGKSQASGG